MKDISLQALVRALREEIDLPGDQENIDVAKPKGKITSADFKKLRSMKNEGPDHEVAMAMSSLKEIVSNATQLMQKLGDVERNIPGWIQDHITNAENYIEQANQGFHELGPDQHTDELPTDDIFENTSYRDELVSIDIAEDTSYKDFAIAVANVLKEDYGEHNFKRFVQTLVTELKS